MGHHNLRFIGNTHADSGLWGPPTSTSNFCEEDYAVVNFLAEFINSITNMAYIYYALRHLPRGDARTTWYRRMDFMAFSLIGVGVCSFAFHATMRQIPQYSDDLSMLLLAGALLHPVYAANRTPAVRRLIAVTLIAIIGSVALIYVRDGNLLIHTFAFIVLITFLWPRTLWLVYHTGSSKEERRRMMGHFTWAAVSIIVGFALWNMDLEYCFDLRAAREWLGTPLAWVLELHGWWHILTALAASHFIRLIRMVTDVKTHKG